MRLLPGAVGFTGVPPVTETRFVSTEMVMHVGPNVPRAEVEAAAARHGMIIVAAQPSAITGGTLYICQVPAGVQVATAVGAMEAENIGDRNAELRVRAHPGRGARNRRRRLHASRLIRAIHHRQVAACGGAQGRDRQGRADRGDRFQDRQQASRSRDARSPKNTTRSAVPIRRIRTAPAWSAPSIAQRKLLGIAPNAKILAVHAFATSTRQSPEATTRQILAGIEWAIQKGARIINMSFAGPHDPMIQLAMKNAHEKGVILIAAAGNLGPKSPPLYPAADPNVIAVTATDDDDQLFTGAVRGPHLAVAAPGVDIMVPAPDETYQSPPAPRSRPRM